MQRVMNVADKAVAHLDVPDTAGFITTVAVDEQKYGGCSRARADRESNDILPSNF